MVSRQEVLGRNKNIEIGGLNVEQAVKVPTKLSKTVKLKKVKVRRGGKTVLGKKLKVISTNSQGDKFTNLSGLVKSKEALVFMVQETQLRKKGKHKLDNYELFESKRSQVGGGSLLGVHQSLNPVLINVYENEFELIVVEAKCGSKEIRFITGYGPQEDLSDDIKAPFFIALDQEINKAIASGKSVYAAMDINSKLGPEYIPNDPHQMSKNGEILAEVIERNALIVANGLTEKCVGVITRERNTADGRKEKSVIDVVMITSDLEEELNSINIDEERKNVLTKIVTNKKGEVKKTESDHNIVEVEFSFKVKTFSSEVKEEMYNLKNPECQKKFKKHTENTKMADIFNSSKHIDILTEKFIKMLNAAIKGLF